MPTKKVSLGLLTLLFAITSIAPQIQAQTIIEKTPAKQQLPRTTLYRHFLAHIQFVSDESKSSQMQRFATGRDPAKVYQEQIGLTNLEYSSVKVQAKALATDLQALDKRAQNVIGEFRSTLARNPGSAQQLPPPPQELFRLQEEKEKLLEKHVQTLHALLGTKAQRLDAFVEKSFAPNVKINTIAIPRTYNPAIHPAPAFDEGSH